MSELADAATRSKSDNGGEKRWPAVAAFFIPVVIVGGLLFLMIVLRDGVEAAVANVAGFLPVGWAFAAGMVASVNPCGFLMLPTYISYKKKSRNPIRSPCSSPHKEEKGVTIFYYVSGRKP